MLMDGVTKDDIISIITEFLEPASLYDYDGEEENYSCNYCWNYSYPKRRGVPAEGWDRIIHEDDCVVTKARKLLNKIKEEYDDDKL